MKLSTLEKRVSALEINSVRRSRKPNSRSGQLTGDSTSALLQELREQVWDIKERAEAAGDLRVALLCLRTLHEFVEFEAKLRGELDERPQANIVNVNLDPGLAIRIAQTYVARHATVEPEEQ